MIGGLDVLLSASPSDTRIVFDGINKGDSVASEPETVRSIECIVRGLVDRVGDRYLLANRERQVLCLSAIGRDTKTIAKMLGCSCKTVEEYWQRMFKKVGEKSRQGIAARVLFEAVDCMRLTE